MTKNHLKAVASTTIVPLKRKNKVFLVRPSPGPHSMKDCCTINFLLTEMLRVAKTKKESTYILHNREIKVDNRKVRDVSFPIGLFDVITISDIKKNFRMSIDKQGRLHPVEITKEEATVKPYQIQGKTRIKSKTQLNLSSGKNILVDKDTYKVGDTIILDITKNSIKENIKLEKNNLIFLTAGKHIGALGKIEDVTGSKIIYRIKSDQVFETLKDYAFVIGKSKPLIKLE